MQSVCKRYKLKNTSRCVDLGVIFVLQLTRLNWSREQVSTHKITGYCSIRIYV